MNTTSKNFNNIQVVSVSTLNTSGSSVFSNVSLNNLTTGSLNVTGNSIIGPLISSGGNIGINTSTPIANMSLYGSKYLLNNLIIGGSSLFPPTPFVSNGTTSQSLNVTGQPYGNGTYTVSGSSRLGVSNSPGRAFDGATAGTAWTTPGDIYNSTTGAYIGTQATLVDNINVLGEWLQLQSPLKTLLTQYRIFIQNTLSQPRNITIAASNDGITYTLYDKFDSLINLNIPTAGRLFDINTNYRYSGFLYYRFIFTDLQLNGVGQLSLRELQLFATEEFSSLTSTNQTQSSKIILNPTLASFTNNVRMLNPVNTIGNIFTTAGSVGIGTGSPVSRLDVNGGIAISDLLGQMYLGNPTSGNARLNIRDINNNLLSFYFGNNTVGSINSNGTNPGISINAIGTNQLFLASTGNVGIGTGSPQYTFDLPTGTSRLTSIWGNPFNDVDSRHFVTSGPEDLPANNGDGRFNVQDRANVFIRFYTGSQTNNSVVLRGSITNNNGTTQFNTASDYRLKENLINFENPIQTLKDLKVYKFNYKTNPEQQVSGFLAHEVQQLIPEAVHGVKDEINKNGDPVYQGLDQSKLVPLLVASVKELVKRIEELESKSI